MSPLTTAPQLTNMFGPLDAKIRRRLQQLLNQPRRYWNRDHGIILRTDHGGFGLTVWQAISAIDPTFPKSGRVTSGGYNGIPEKLVSDWARYPDQVLIARALKYAANLPVKGQRRDR